MGSSKHRGRGLNRGATDYNRDSPDDLPSVGPAKARPEGMAYPPSGTEVCEQKRNQKRRRTGGRVAYEVRAEGSPEGAGPLGSNYAPLPVPGAAIAWGPSGRRSRGVVVRVEPGRYPNDDEPGRVARVYVRPGPEPEAGA